MRYEEAIQRVIEQLEKVEKIAVEKIEKKLVEVASEVVAAATLLSPTGESRHKKPKEKKVSFINSKGTAVSYTRKSKGESAYTGGLLRKSWQMSRIYNRDSGGNISRGIIISNSAHYAVHVEYGHRTRHGTSKNPKYKAKGIRYVKGQNILQEALKRAGVPLKRTGV